MSTVVWLSTSLYGRAVLSKYIPEESPRARHRRRALQATLNEKEIVSWCAYRGVEVSARRPSDNPDLPYWYFHFTLPTGAFARWIPSRARFLCKPRLRDKITFKAHVHDYYQLFDVLSWWLEEASKPLIPDSK